MLQYNSVKHIRNQSHRVFMYGMVITYSKGEDQPSKVASPARGQLNRVK